MAEVAEAAVEVAAASDVNADPAETAGLFQGESEMAAEEGGVVGEAAVVVLGVGVEAVDDGEAGFIPVNPAAGPPLPPLLLLLLVLWLGT